MGYLLEGLARGPESSIWSFIQHQWYTIGISSGHLPMLNRPFWKWAKPHRQSRTISVLLTCLAAARSQFNMVVSIVKIKAL